MTGVTGQLPRCTMRGCPWRFTDGGPDRRCPGHADDPYTFAVRLARFGVMELAPGDHDGDGDDDGDGQHDDARDSA